MALYIKTQLCRISLCNKHNHDRSYRVFQYSTEEGDTVALQLISQISIYYMIITIHLLFDNSEFMSC